MLAESVGATGNGGGAEDYILIRDEKSQGVHGGGFTSSSWLTRDLTVIISNIGGHASLAANQITLAAGTYKVEAYATGFKVDQHKIKLRNITDGTDIAIGSSVYSGASDFSGEKSVVDGRFTIDATKIIELQHRCGTTRTSFGRGFASSFGVIEVYANIEFWKEA